MFRQNVFLSIMEKKRIAVNEEMQVLVRFGIGGNLRFLSHLEQMVMFQRACVRAGVPLVYTQGFNPHPIISIPLPRPVGIESDDDFFCLRIKGSKADFDQQDFGAELSAQMPIGFKLNSVSVSQSKKIPAPQKAEYFLPVKKNLLDDNIRVESLKNKISGLLSAKNVFVTRGAEEKKRRIKKVDIRPFIDDIKFGEKGVTISCEISSGGTIRVDEIMNLLGLSADDLTGAVRRTMVEWNLES